MRLARRALARLAPRARRRRARLNLRAESIGLRLLDGTPGPARIDASRDLAGAGTAESLEALRALLAAHADVVIEARLACAWHRVFLLPWAAQLTREARWLNLARARFEEVFGESAEAWDFRVARDLPGCARLAVAWPVALRAELAAAPQVVSVRVDLLEQLALLVSKEPRFTGCLAEIDGDRAGFVLIADGGVRRIRLSRFDGSDALVTAMRAEWAAIGADRGIGADEPALALTPPEATPGSPRARAAAALAAGLDFKRAFCLRECGP